MRHSIAISLVTPVAREQLAVRPCLQLEENAVQTVGYWSKGWGPRSGAGKHHAAEHYYGDLRIEQKQDETGFSQPRSQKVRRYWEEPSESTAAVQITVSKASLAAVL